MKERACLLGLGVLPGAKHFAIALDQPLAEAGHALQLRQLLRHVQEHQRALTLAQQLHQQHIEYLMC